MKLSISKSKNSESLYISKSIRSGGKSTSKNVKKLGTMAELLPLHDNSREKVIEWAKKEAKRMTEEEKREKDTVIIPLSQSKLIEHGIQTMHNCGYLFLQDIFYELKLDRMCDEISKKHQFQYNLTDILSRLIYSRILYPSSKRSTYSLSKIFLEPVSFQLADVYRSLSVLSEESDYIQEYLYEKSINVVKRNTNILYYDCTNYFFEIEEGDGFRENGPSKEHRTTPIVQMGLFMDGDGYPLAFTIFPGNNSEQTSMRPLEEKIIKDFQLAKMVVCTDAGLASTENRKFNNMGNRSYIVTQSLKKIKGHIKNWALSTDEWSTSKNKTGSIDISDIIESTDKNIDCYDEKVDNIVWYKEKWINENGLSQRIIVSFSPKYRKYQRKIRNKQIARAEAKAAKNNNSIPRSQNSPSRFLEETAYTETGEVAKEREVSINRDKIAQEEQYDGFYAICTTLSDPIEDIIEINKRRWEIEESFRIMKSEFKARPVYLRRQDRIEAHFLTCFLSLFITRVLENKINYACTIEKLIQTLKEMNMQHHNGWGYVPTYTRDEITDKLHEAFNFRTDYQITSENNMKKILKKTKR